MKKQTKVLLAAAMMTIGATFSSMAALKSGTWVLNDEGWQYADKEGEYVDSKWCLSYGKEYWINEDGVLGASEWVTDEEGYKYYVQSDGSKAISAWKYIFAENDDESEEESWFYFDAKGRMVANDDRVIGDYTYYFNDKGQMLTGWVDATRNDAITNSTVIGDVVYANEDGQVIKNGWVNMFPWNMDEDDAYDEDYAYYYAGSKGKLVVNDQKKVDGLTYIFGNHGKMLTGWVQLIDGTYTDANAAITANTKNAYFADEEVGYIKKNTWRELSDPTGNDTYWYFLDKLGRAYIATNTDATATTANALTFADGEAAAISSKFTTKTNGANLLVNIKKYDGKEYYMNAKGEMLDGIIEINNNIYYLVDGAKVTGKVTLADSNENDYTFFFGEKNSATEGYVKYAAVTGNAGGYLYENGQLVTSSDKDVFAEVSVTNPVTGQTASFVVNYEGKIQHSDGKKYEGVTNKHNFAVSNKGWNDDCITATLAQ